MLPGLLLSVALLAGTAEAPPPPPTLSLRLGVRVDAVREDLLVPLTFTGPGPALGVGFDGALGPGRLVAQGTFGLAVLFNRFGQLAATVDASLLAAWLLPLPLPGSWTLGLGPALGWDTRLAYLYAWDDAHGYWLGAQWLGPAARLEGPLGGGWRLSVSLALAALGFQGRPPAYRFIKQEAVDHLAYWLAAPLQAEALATPATLQLGQLELGLRPPAGVTPGWSFGLRARVEHTSVPAAALGLGLVAFASRDWELPR